MTVETLLSITLSGGLIAAAVTWLLQRRQPTVDTEHVIESLQRDVILTQEQVARLGAEAYANLTNVKMPAPDLPGRTMHVLVSGPEAEDKPNPFQPAIDAAKASGISYVELTARLEHMQTNGEHKADRCPDCDFRNALEEIP